VHRGAFVTTSVVPIVVMSVEPSGLTLRAIRSGPGLQPDAMTLLAQGGDPLPL
jgi:hypothetical protein